MKHLPKISFSLFACLLLLTACNVRPTTFEETLSKEQREKYGYAEQSRFGGEKSLFAPDKDKSGRDSTNLFAGNSFGGTVQVNRYLWTASLDVASFMPLSQVDAVGGVIITEWHALPEQPNQRYKANITMSGTVLRADALNVALFKQVRNGSQWQSAPVSDETTQQFKDSILTRARELRFFSLGAGAQN
ncbi:MAG: DUF3576 domain-containing protein [Alphaproteobacteria bacterium]|nr:DUF3576 domain-containing protein [Alphaproteobacteria bacterium]